MREIVSSALGPASLDDCLTRAARSEAVALTSLIDLVAPETVGCVEGAYCGLPE